MSKIEKEKKKAEHLAKNKKDQPAQKKNEEEVLEDYEKDPNDPSAHLFGDRPLIRSTVSFEEINPEKYSKVRDITVALEGKEVILRARVHRNTSKGGACFLVLRESFYTCQACMFVEGAISKGMIDYSKRISRESMVEIKGVVKLPEAPLSKVTQQAEILISELWTLHKSEPRLAFNLDDAANIVENQEEEDDSKKETVEEEKQEKGKKKKIIIGQNTRLDNRILDLRVPTNQAIMRIQGGICRYFREFLDSKDFTEIHSPKLLGGTSEGGSEVFRLQYFNQPACLAQSPQLYKQMGVVCDLERVYEIGPVFRAEDSNTPRHLCEFTGLDLETSFYDHYFEVVDLI